MASDSKAVAFAPGRVNVIGEHTDYNAGLSLPFAIEQGVTVTAHASSAGRFEVRALDLGEEDRFECRRARGASGWRALVRGVACELEHGLCDARVEISSTLRARSGLSSSAALEVALSLALLALGGAAPPEPFDLAELCAGVERDWLGVSTGLLDQVASIACTAGQALRIDFRSRATEPVPLELGGWRLVVVDSRERRAMAASGYNERRTECDRACAQLGVATLRDAPRATLASLPPPLAQRAQHVLDENARVDAAVAALRARDLERLGALLDASHASLRDLYECSTEAVERAVRRLKATGAAGARMIGGGFGGHVLALLPPDVPPPAGAREVRPEAGARVAAPSR